MHAMSRAGAGRARGCTARIYDGGKAHVALCTEQTLRNNVYMLMRMRIVTCARVN